jgi:hypothetical protein
VSLTKVSTCSLTLQFLDSTDENVTDMPLPHVPDASRPRVPLAPKQQRAPAADGKAGMVWVDCFFYGFYIEKARLPQFQASVRKKRHADVAGPAAGAVPV